MSRLEQLAVADIAPSPLNPRKHFDDAEIEELAASLRQDGVLQPLVVRPRGGALPEEIPDGPEPYFNRMAAAVGRAAASFELVAGERRWRAAQRAGLESVPAVVRTDLDDLAVLRLMIVENVQRSSLRPIEEATACRALLDADAGADVAAVADLVGRSASWVHQRVQLLKLTAGCLASVEAGRVSAGHAVEIARLEPADQDLALAECDFEGRDVPSWKEPASVRGLKRWIRDHIPLTRRDPAAAHRGVPVTLSPYLDNHNGTLTPAERKRILRADAFRVVKDGTAACAVAAVVVLGERAGEALRICPRRSKCETHWGEHFREQARRRKEEERWKQERRESDAGRQQAEQERERFKRETWPRIERAMRETPFDLRIATRAVQQIVAEQRYLLDIGDLDIEKEITPANWFEWLLRAAIGAEWNRDGILERAQDLLPGDALDAPADVCTAAEEARA